MLLTTAQDVAAILRAVPRGRQLDMKTLRADLARKHGAEIACPVVTGIHLRSVAEAVVGRRRYNGSCPQ